MIVKVLGTGCAKCHHLEQRVRDVVAEAGLSARIEKVEDVAEIVRYGVTSTPALVVGDEVIGSGPLASQADLTRLLVGAHRAAESAQQGATES